jgi:hypothetical protein
MVFSLAACGTRGVGSGHDRLGKAFEEPGEGLPHLRIELLQKFHVLFRQIVEDLPGKAKPLLSHLQDDDPSVRTGGSLPDQPAVHKAVRQAAGGALLQAEAVPELGYGNGPPLDQGLESVALAYGELVAAGSIPVPGL